MMPFAEFRQRYLDCRLAHSDILRISNTADMAHAYWLLSDDEEQQDAALAFINQCRAQINEQVRRDVAATDEHQRKAAIAAVEVRS